MTPREPHAAEVPRTAPTMDVPAPEMAEPPLLRSVCPQSPAPLCCQSSLPKGGRSLPQPGRTSRTGLAAGSIIDRPPKEPWRDHGKQEAGERPAAKENRLWVGSVPASLSWPRCHADIGTGLFCHLT